MERQRQLVTALVTAGRMGQRFYRGSSAVAPLLDKWVSGGLGFSFFDKVLFALRGLRDRAGMAHTSLPFRQVPCGS